MKKHFIAALVFGLAFSQTATAFTLKLVSISGDRAEVLVDGMPRSFPIGFTSREGIKLISASSGSASFQAGSNAFTLAPGQVFDEAVCRDQQKNGGGFRSSPCGVASTASESDMNRQRLESNNAYQADRDRQRAAADAYREKKEFEAALRPPQKIR